MRNVSLAYRQYIGITHYFKVLDHLQGVQEDSKKELYKS